MTIPEILNKVKNSGLPYPENMGLEPWDTLTVEEALAQLEALINQAYIEKAKVDEAVGKDERYLDCGVCQGELPKPICSSGRCLFYSAKNELRAEILTKLNLDRSKK